MLLHQSVANSVGVPTVPDVDLADVPVFRAGDVVEASSNPRAEAIMAQNAHDAIDNVRVEGGAKDHVLGQYAP